MERIDPAALTEIDSYQINMALNGVEQIKSPSTAFTIDGPIGDASGRITPDSLSPTYPEC
jgi:hypothetical protein